MATKPLIKVKFEKGDNNFGTKAQMIYEQSPTSKICVSNPVIYYGKAKMRDDEHSFSVVERHCSTPTLVVSINKYYEFHGEGCFIPKLLHGRKVKISIEVLDE